MSAFGERAYLSVLQGSDTLTILSESVPASLQAVGWVGRNTPAYCTSVGQALLLDHARAELDLRVRRRRLPAARPRTRPRNLDELEARIESARDARLRDRRRGDGAGLVAVAAPVRDPHGRIVAALNVSAPKFRLEAGVDRAGAALVAAAGDLGAALRGERPANVAEGG